MFRLIFFTFFSIYSFICYGADNNSIEDLSKKNLKNGMQEFQQDLSYNDDYIVALKAYDDGLNDVAVQCFINYLIHDNESKKAGFAYYLLYQIYMNMGDFNNAKNNFLKLSTFHDNRFNKEQMLKDQMVIEAKLSCDSAKNLLLTSKRNEHLEMFAKSSCVVDKDIVELINKIDINTNALYAVLERVQNDKELVLTTYKSLSPEKRTPKLLNFYGKYFYSNNMKTEFYNLYKEYKDGELTAIVLDDIWKSKDYKSYVNIFNKQVKPEYQLDRLFYCRMIEASNKEGFNFDCDLVDKCINIESREYNKTKLACYMKREDKEKIMQFIDSLPTDDTLKLCEYGKYIIGKNLYNIKFIGKFEGCKDKVSMYESLLKFKDYNAIIKLGGSAVTQEDIAYMAIAYYYLGNSQQHNNYLSKLKNIDLSGMVKQKISRGSL